MSGIINYFHGETGTVSACWWALADEAPSFVMAIDGNPHRAIAYDTGSDIGIDPQIAPGDEVVYLRLDDTCGIWVVRTRQSAADLVQALRRVLDHRAYIERWRSAAASQAWVEVARAIFEDRGEPLRVTSTRAGEPGVLVVEQGWAIVALRDREPSDDRPRPGASFFLSHAAEDSLLARRVYEDLQHDANADIWFDLAQPTQSVPDDDAAISAWLHRSMREANGFVVLWTEHAAQSAWVRQEFKWAHALGQSQPGFHAILLQLRDVPVPPELGALGTVIDCDAIWWSNGLNEALYAAIFKRQPRSAWLASLAPGAPVAQGQTIGHGDFVSDAGVVVAFDWAFEDRSRAESLRWQLDYRRRDGTLLHAVGAGSDQAADLDLKPGDRVGFYKVRWRHGNHVLHGPALWMRSGDMALTSDMVLDRYHALLHTGRA